MRRFGGSIRWLVFLAFVLGTGCRPARENVVVVYTSQDQIYAQKILTDFTRETGIRVLPLFDSESAKTTGLMNRIIAERLRPQCDVFWSNEEMMMRKLGRRGLLAEAPIVSFGYRSRRLIVNTNFIEPDALPIDLKQLAAPKWKGRVAIAYPLFGTTAAHFMSLRAAWGKDVWEQWCRDLVKNKVLILDGNSAVVRLVGMGEVWLGLTDFDDAVVGLRKQLPIKMLPRTQEFSVIANSVALIRNGPNPQNARRFQEYLQRRQTQERLLALGALEGIAPPKETAFLQTDWERVLDDFESTYTWLGETFLR